MGRELSTVVHEFCAKYDKKFKKFDEPNMDNDDMKAWMYDFDRVEEPEILMLACVRVLNEASWKNECKPSLIMKLYHKMGGKSRAKATIVARESKQEQKSKADELILRGEINRMISMYNSLNDDIREAYMEETTLRLARTRNGFLKAMLHQQKEHREDAITKYILRRELALTVARDIKDAGFLLKFPESYADMDFESVNDAREKRERARQEHEQSNAIVKPTSKRVEPELQQAREPAPQDQSEEPIPTGSDTEIPW